MIRIVPPGEDRVVAIVEVVGTPALKDDSLDDAWTKAGYSTSQKAWRVDLKVLANLVGRAITRETLRMNGVTSTQLVGEKAERQHACSERLDSAAYEVIRQLSTAAPPYLRGEGKILYRATKNALKDFVAMPDFPACLREQYIKFRSLNGTIIEGEVTAVDLVKRRFTISNEKTFGIDEVLKNQRL